MPCELKLKIFYFRDNSVSMRVKKILLGSRLVLAPMSGITDYPFRRLAREMEAGLLFTEMISAEGLLRKDGSFLRIGADEHPISVQLFGSNPETLANAARLAESIGADGVDINMGCPAREVVESGAGALLMRFPEKVERILTEVRKQVKGLLTIKIRSGWDSTEINAAEISKRAEACGVDAISIHARTKVQGFRGLADWSVIREVKKTIDIPVIGNGDARTPFLVEKMFSETNCDLVMIGRGALGNPWIFRTNGSGIRDRYHGPSLEERLKVIEHHFSLIENFYPPEKALSEMKRHLAWYTRGLPSSSQFRSRLPRIKELDALLSAAVCYFEEVEKGQGRRLEVSCR